jgi:aryl-alcohol dehydrogenase-like predicted oxidoreductase
MKKKKSAAIPAGVSPKLYGLPFTMDEFNAMPYRRLGNSGLRVSNVGLGTWKFGYPQTGDGARVDEKAAFKIFDKAIEEGVTFWDTANRYNNSSGNSERIIGRWFKRHPGERRNVELATKLYGTMDGKTPNYCRLSRVNILEATYSCLDRLQTDRIELMQFHSFDDSTPIEESLMAMEDLISQDLVRYFGVSNFGVSHLEQYITWSAIFRRSQIQSVQNQFDILYGEDPAKTGVLDFCARTGMSFIAWSPLRGGLLSERYIDRSAVSKGDRLVDENRLDEELTPAVQKKLAPLVRLARQWDLTLTQLALAYMLHISGMGPVIAACSTPQQVAENARAGKVKLDKSQVGAVERIIRPSWTK